MPSPAARPILTLLTDFSHKDGYPAVMKAVILSLAVDADIIDISHEIPPQNVFSGSLVLGRSFHYFPAGSIHIAVVDPGVGTTRRPMAARLGNHFLVLPDNGLITHALEYARKQEWPVKFFELNQPQYWLPEISRSFHGRDIFAPSAGHLASGVTLERLGTPLETPLLLAPPEPQPLPYGWEGQVIETDHFGNLITNLTEDHLSPNAVRDIRCGKVRIKGMVQTFGDRPSGAIVAIFDSDGRLSICKVNGSAAESLRLGAGEPVQVLLQTRMDGTAFPQGEA